MVQITPFTNRLSKNFKHFGKWARRQGIEAWRVYDRDIPQFPLAIDMYGAEHCHVQEYDTGWMMSDEARDAWLGELLQGISQCVGVPIENMGFKTRRRQRGLSQYEKTGEAGDAFVVHEHGLAFWVNMAAYLDTGLFLDHRNTRLKVMQEAAGKRFLNLFAYTGSFTVHAAAGGAVSSETVDLSNTYLDWAGRNFALNSLDPAYHTLVREDVFKYLSEATLQKRSFDLIVMDPPSFSNSKKMLDVLDVQRDHAWLVEQAMRLLTPGGALYFSNNLRSFALDERLPIIYQVSDISSQSIPEDFRNQKIHRCYQIRHRQ